MHKRMQYNAHLAISVLNARLIFLLQHASLRPVSFSPVMAPIQILPSLGLHCLLPTFCQDPKIVVPKRLRVRISGTGEMV